MSIRWVRWEEVQSAKERKKPKMVKRQGRQVAGSNPSGVWGKGQGNGTVGWGHGVAGGVNGNNRSVR